MTADPAELLRRPWIAPFCKTVSVGPSVMVQRSQG
jgi:hypothetical protein